MALRIAKRILRKNLVDFCRSARDIEIIEIEVSDRMVGKIVIMDLRRRYSLNVIAIHHEKNRSRQMSTAGLSPVPWRYDHRDRKGRKRDAFR